MSSISQSLSVYLELSEGFFNSFSMLARAFGWFGLISAILYVLQRKGWGYQLLPFFLSVATGSFILFLAVLREHPVTPVYLRSTTVLAAGLVLSSLILCLLKIKPQVFSQPLFNFPSSRYTAVIMALTHPDERVLFFDSSVEPAFPALTYTSRQFGGRFLCAYPIAFIFHESSNYEVPPQWRKEENAIYEMFVADITHQHPRLVFIRTRPGGQALPAYFSVSQYLKQRGFYETALGSYILLGYVGPFEVHLLPSSDEKTHEQGNGKISTLVAIRSLIENNILRNHP